MTTPVNSAAIDSAAIDAFVRQESALPQQGNDKKRLYIVKNKEGQEQLVCDTMQKYKEQVSFGARLFAKLGFATNGSIKKVALYCDKKGIKNT